MYDYILVVCFFFFKQKTAYEMLRSLVGSAQTGSGKTAAFALPLLQQLQAGATHTPRRVRALILVPTRELAAQVGEVVRGALSSVPKGQTDAAKSLGLTFWPRLFHVSLPQSMPVIIPPWTNTAAELVKGTSLASLLSMSELLFATRKIVERTGDVLPFYIAAAAIYFVICFSIARIGVLVAQRYRFGVAR